jgi:hypothetical protein
VSLLKVVRKDWNGTGTQQWAERMLKPMQTDEQLVLFRGEDDI